MSSDFTLVPDPDMDVIGELLAVCPSFRPVLKDHLASSSGEPRLPFVEAGAFGRHIVQLVSRGDTREFLAVFNAIERLYGKAGPAAETLLTYGLLETVQNVAMNEGVALEGFEQFLGPRTRLEWDYVIRIWNPEAPPRTRQ